MGDTPLERPAVKPVVIPLLGALLALTNPIAARAGDNTSQTGATRTSVIVAVGAPGEPEFGADFAAQAALWRQVCSNAGCAFTLIGADALSRTNTLPPDGPADPPAARWIGPSGSDAAPVAASLPVTNSAGADAADLKRLKEVLATEPKDGLEPLWLVLIGHGTFDGKEAKLNLQGADLSASDLLSCLQPFHRPIAIVDTTSSSGPFLPKLSGTNRVVVAATRSGYEQNFTRFGRRFVMALASSGSDLDGDEQTSLLEAFLGAAHDVSEFYRTEGRLATEHPLIDDNGDGLGTPADWFRGVRAAKRAKDNAPLDGVRAHQFHLIRSEAENRLSAEDRARRDGLEMKIAALRETKDHRPADEYYKELEQLLLSVAHLYEAAESRP